MAVGFRNLEPALQAQIAPGVGQIHYMVDSDRRTAAQGWSRADGTGPLDLWQGRHEGSSYVFRTDDYTSDAAAIEAANDAMVDYRGDILFFTPGRYAPATVINVDVPYARWTGTPYKTPAFGASPAVANATITTTIADVFSTSGTIEGMEFSYLRNVTLTAQDTWIVGNDSDFLYFHDFEVDHRGVATNAASQFMTATSTGDHWLFDSFSSYTDAPQGPVLETDVINLHLRISNFYLSHAETGGTLAIALWDCDGAGTDGFIVGPGKVVVGAVGTGVITSIVDFVDLTGTAAKGYITDVHGCTGVATTTTLSVHTADDVEVVNCYNADDSSGGTVAVSMLAG